MSTEDQRRVVLETLDRINRSVAGDPNSLPNMLRPEASYIDLVDRLLGLIDEKPSLTHGQR